MYNDYVNKYTQILNWGKLIFPTKLLKYYPPKFVLRDSIYQGIKSALKNGNEVAVIVYHIQNLQELAQQFETNIHMKYLNTLKHVFQTTIHKEVAKGNVIALHDYYRDGITLFLRVNHKMDGASSIEKIISSIKDQVLKTLSTEFTEVKPILDTGYMFINKKSEALHGAIDFAHQQAVMMAQKRLDSEFNEMVYALSKIVATKDIRLLAQPIMDVETNQIRACEMLTRGPRGTILESPLQLFSIARQTRFLYDLEMIVLEKTLEQIKLTTWQYDIFINFTPLTIGNPRFVKDLKKLMSKYKGISPNKITIEVTERDSIEGLEYFISNLKILRMNGFRIAVDDTGAGYASLNSISEIMPDIIKIDRSVIQNIDKNSVKESMLKGLLLIAKEVGSIVVAEGIESAEEASVLSRNKVDLAQGYFYAKPTSLSNNLQAL